MANRFQEILQQGIEQGIIVDRSAASKQWFRDRASEVKNMGIGEVLEAMDQSSYRARIGRMIMFKYDPKTADDLRYYDTFPIVIPFEITRDGFMGINFHYLPRDLRAKLMDGLYEYVSDSSLSDTARIRITYELLKSATKLKYFRPCVKRYLNTSLRSRFIVVPPSQWDIALFLPLERFRKSTKENVYRDSRRIIRGF